MLRFIVDLYIWGTQENICLLWPGDLVSIEVFLSASSVES